MNILFDKATSTFRLDTKSSSYLFQIVKGGYLCHLYWGGHIEDTSMVGISRLYAEAYDPADGDMHERPYPMRFIPQEFACDGITDFRISAVRIEAPDGTTATDFRYQKHEIIAGKMPIDGLPATYAEPDEAMTLKIWMRDTETDMEAILWYTVFEAYDAITRHVTLTNHGEHPTTVKRLYSACTDFAGSDFDILYLYGAWATEANVGRIPVPKSVFTVQSNRGISSHEHNPFLALCAKGADENKGDVYGFSFVYSGSFCAQVEADTQSLTRVIMGFNPDNFSWRLEPGEEISSPEVVMVHSSEGLTNMSQTYHSLYRNQLCRGKWKYQRRPVLINSWEPFLFDFNKEKLLRLARESADVGVELFVLDDGWFGERNSATTSLGDWYVNQEKIGGTLSELANEIRAMGLKFGLWFEPEMISKNSNLYRAHPDWCLHSGGRPRSELRNQLVLDFSRPEVVDYIIDAVSKVLESAPIDYVKWDMNRSLSEVGSTSLPRERQGEVYHRYIIGLYRAMETLTSRFPDILFEGCSGGGGRFDPGILYYMPQFWGSDNTDAMDRLNIHYGETLVYPLSSLSAHVSAVPNLQVNRTTPLSSRFHAALTGSFGYELDICKLTDQEKEQIREQIATYKQYQDLLMNGDYYRLISPFEGNGSAWIVVSKDKREALAGYFKVLSKRWHRRSLRLKGLDDTLRYRQQGTDYRYYGSTLMNAGIPLPKLWGDFLSCLFHLKAE